MFHSRQAASNFNNESIEIPAVSTIIPLPEVSANENNGRQNDYYQSPYDQSNHTLTLENTSTAGTLSFRDLKYTLYGARSNPRRRKCCESYLKPESPKRILNKVSGIFKPGMNAIMGKKYLKKDFEILSIHI